MPIMDNKSAALAAHRSRPFRCDLFDCRVAILPDYARTWRNPFCLECTAIMLTAVYSQFIRNMTSSERCRRQNDQKKWIASGSRMKTWGSETGFHDQLSVRSSVVFEVSYVFHRNDFGTLQTHYLYQGRYSVQRESCFLERSCPLFSRAVRVLSSVILLKIAILSSFHNILTNNESISYKAIYLNIERCKKFWFRRREQFYASSRFCWVFYLICPGFEIHCPGFENNLLVLEWLDKLIFSLRIATKTNL